jgi:hypothetical protein
MAGDLFRDGEHDMEILAVEEFRLPFLDPLGASQRLTFWADLEISDRYLETFVVSSWAEHLRHDRLTRADSQLEEQLRSCTVCEPNVRHLLYL